MASREDLHATIYDARLAAIEHAIHGPAAPQRLCRRGRGFLRRAADEGLLRRGRTHSYAGPLLPELVHLAAHRLAHLSPGQAADVAVDTYLRGLGGRSSGCHANAAPAPGPGREHRSFT